MKGLLRKDFYMLWSYNKMFLILIFGFIALSALPVNGDNTFFFYYPCILGSALPVYLLAYDEAEHWCTFCDTLPVTRQQFVAGKYLMGLICAGIISILSAAAAGLRMVRSGGFDSVDFGDQLAILAAIAPLPAALCLPLMFKYGTQKGRIALFVVIGLFCGVTILVDPPELSGLSFPIWALPVLSAALFVISWLLSVRFYQKREF
ncbi:MAG: ABC-2 transporter permease [Firmicutes bacterium]|nr:ABC-2 transporter permease [Bacillota bacterium]